MMRIIELNTITGEQERDLLVLMQELDPEIVVTGEMLKAVVKNSASHLFAALDEEGRVVGCATLCVYYSPTGCKASVEDVVVLSSCRGQQLGRKLMDHVIEYARRVLGNVDLGLTSRPRRVVANKLYQSLGFQRRDTNIYRLSVRESNVKV